MGQQFEIAHDTMTNSAILTRRSRRNQSGQSPVLAKPAKIVTIASAKYAEPYSLIPFIEEGYRVNHTLRDSIVSWVTLHSDTVNIWTHFIGFCYFVWGFFHVWEVLTSTGATTMEYVSFSFYLCCALFQMGSSTLYHTVRCISPWHDSFFLRLDVAGITAMILGSNVVALHQGFHCQPLYILLYTTVLLCLLSVAGIMALQPGFQTSEWDFARNTSLSACVAFGAIPAYHWAVHCNFHCVHIVMWALLGMFGNYFIGFCFFVSRIPERWIPQKFDIWGSSHQIWHVFVVIAGVSWLHGILEFHRWRINHGAHCDATEGMELPIPFENT